MLVKIVTIITSLFKIEKKYGIYLENLGEARIG